MVTFWISDETFINSSEHYISKFSKRGFVVPFTICFLRLAINFLHDFEQQPISQEFRPVLTVGDVFGRTFARRCWTFAQTKIVLRSARNVEYIRSRYRRAVKVLSRVQRNSILLFLIISDPNLTLQVPYNFKSGITSRLDDIFQKWQDVPPSTVS